MPRKSILGVAAFLAAKLLAARAVAGADDYVFEPVNSEIKSSNVATVAVRLVHKPSGKPVTDAAIVQTRIDMSPDGRASMASAIVPLPSPGPGMYPFKAPLTTAARWLLMVSAKVQGEPYTVIGKITFNVNR